MSDCRYFSSIYQYPTISLGPRFEFESVSVDERRRGNRHYLFSFEGSTGEGSYLKADRLALADVVQNHNWKVRRARCSFAYANCVVWRLVFVFVSLFFVVGCM